MEEIYLDKHYIKKMQSINKGYHRKYKQADLSL